MSNLRNYELFVKHLEMREAAAVFEQHLSHTGIELSQPTAGRQAKDDVTPCDKSSSDFFQKELTPLLQAVGKCVSAKGFQKTFCGECAPKKEEEGEDAQIVSSTPCLLDSQPVSFTLSDFSCTKILRSYNYGEMRLKNGTINDLSVEQIQDFKEAFSLFEVKQHFGTHSPLDELRINAKDLAVVMRSLGQNPSADEISQWTQELLGQQETKQELAATTTSEEKFIYFTDFLSLMARLLADETDEEDNILDAFKTIDRDGGSPTYTSIPELRHVLENLGGERLTDEEIDEMIKEVDTYGDGQIDYEDFVRMMMSK